MPGTSAARVLLRASTAPPHPAYNGGMRGASRITLVAGGLLVAAAWVIGSFGPVGRYRAISDILAEAVAVLVLILAWRYRRDRLAVATIVIAAANFVIRTGRVPMTDEAALTSLAMIIAIDIAILAVTRDRPVSQPVGLVWITGIALQIWYVIVGVHLAEGAMAVVLERPGLAEGAFTAAAIVVLISFIIRRGAFEAGLIWVLAASAAALIGNRGPDPATLFFAAAQLSLLVGLFEDSYRLAFHDELTGLPGRRALDEALRGLGGTFTIAMVDIDHFKRFNDRHGHDAGDQVLRMVADQLAGTGGGGRAHRYGGEEFAILFPGKSMGEVRDDVEDLRRSIADRTFALRAPNRPRSKPEKPKRTSRPPKTVTVTVSIGAATSNSRRPSPRSVLKAADNALYRAKKEGRNRLVAAGDRLPKRT